MKTKQDIETAVSRVVAMREAIERVIKKLEQERLEAEKKKRESEK